MSEEPKVLRLRLAPDVVIPTPSADTITALRLIRDQLAWEGPMLGKVMGHVVIERRLAEALDRDLRLLRDIKPQ